MCSQEQTSKWFGLICVTPPLLQLRIPCIFINARHISTHNTIRRSPYARIDAPFNGVTLNHSVGRNEQLSVSDRLGLVLVLFSWPVGSFDFKISCITIVLINTSCQEKRPRTRMDDVHSDVPVPAAVRLLASRLLLPSATAADIPRCRSNGSLLHGRPGVPGPYRWPLHDSCSCPPRRRPPGHPGTDPAAAG